MPDAALDARRPGYKRVDSSTTGTTTTLYVGGKAMEEISQPNGDIVQKHYIGDFAVVTITQPLTGGAGATTTDYLHHDHLGSIEAITDSAGQVVQRMSFDSWGRRRGTSWQPMTDAAIAAFSTSGVSAITTRGFTNHEMVDSVGLVHMNGRIPEVGCFRLQHSSYQTAEHRSMR